MSMIRQYDLPHDFSKRCRNQARRVATAYDADHAGDGRIDLSRKTIVTIDPDNARDFDDAISLKHMKGEWKLGIHIADVSHFVKPGSALDDEARERGNSVYFPGHVIPMLPETLSNGVCSLQEGVPRLCKSAFIRYGSDGRVLDERVCNSVICSTRRLTYEEASLILDGRVGGFNRAVVNLVREMDRLARVIQQRRLAEGMLVLDLPSVELVLNDDGAVVDVVPEDQSFSHTIIEMFMVEANEAVARLLRAAKTPYLRRIHPDPDRHSGEAAAGILNGLGYDMDAHPGRFAIQQALKQVKGRPEALPVNLAVLRSMQRAEYSPKQIGHYALASDCYTHFTSPIRRYPDLTIHRLLDGYIRGELTDDHHDSNVPGTHTLSQLGRHCSSTERRAEAAERELRTVKVLRFLSDRVGDTLKGVITGVTDFGLFVQLDKYGIEGLVRREDLPDDWWTVLPESGCLVGENTGQRYSIGDSAEVTIVRIDVPSRNLDLHLDRRTSRAGRAVRKTSQRGKRPAAQPRRKAKPGNTRQRRRRTR
ncbi:MAG: VacB/RNase II family 3'-5' exoribonuclease [Gemmatimonadota bacterium]